MRPPSKPKSLIRWTTTPACDGSYAAGETSGVGEYCAAKRGGGGAADEQPSAEQVRTSHHRMQTTIVAVVQATALVHEVYIRLIDAKAVPAESREHFLAMWLPLGAVSLGAGFLSLWFPAAVLFRPIRYPRWMAALSPGCGWGR